MQYGTAIPKDVLLTNSAKSFTRKIITLQRMKHFRKWILMGKPHPMKMHGNPLTEPALFIPDVRAVTGQNMFS